MLAVVLGGKRSERKTSRFRSPSRRTQLCESESTHVSARRIKAASCRYAISGPTARREDLISLANMLMSANRALKTHARSLIN